MCCYLLIKVNLLTISLKMYVDYGFQKPVNNSQTTQWCFCQSLVLWYDCNATKAAIAVIIVVIMFIYLSSNIVLFQSFIILLYRPTQLFVTVFFKFFFIYLFQNVVARPAALPVMDSCQVSYLKFCNQLQW